MENCSVLWVKEQQLLLHAQYHPDLAFPFHFSVWFTVQSSGATFFWWISFSVFVTQHVNSLILTVKEPHDFRAVRCWMSWYFRSWGWCYPFEFFNSTDINFLDKHWDCWTARQVTKALTYVLLTEAKNLLIAPPPHLHCYAATKTVRNGVSRVYRFQ